MRGLAARIAPELPGASGGVALAVRTVVVAQSGNVGGQANSCVGSGDWRSGRTPARVELENNASSWREDSSE
jgi:hypothetical protein